MQDAAAVNLYASSGVAVREFSLKPGHGTADYLLYVNQKAVGVVEAKPEGSTLTGVEAQSEKYSTGLPDNLPAHQRPLPFLYESTGAETQFTNRLDPEARSRLVFSFHSPQTLAKWIGVSETPGTDKQRIAEERSMGDRDPEVLSSLASRLARLDRHLTPKDREAIEDASHGVPLQTLASALVNAADPDSALDAAQQTTGQDAPPESAVAEARQRLLEDAARPFAANPDLRQRLADIHRSYEQTIDTVSADSLIEAGFSDDRARTIVRSFREYIEENRDEITALQVLYERPYRQRLSYADIKALADALVSPPRPWTTERLWQAYRQLDRSKVRGSGQRTLADIVSVVRYAIGGAGELAPFAVGVRERFRGWLAMQETASPAFTEEQMRGLEAIRDHIAGSVSMELSDFRYAPFNQQGGLGKAYELFGDELAGLLEELNGALVE